MNELSLVTGGAGFIGSHLVDELVRRGRPVRVLDDFSTGQRTNLDHHRRGSVEIVEGSLNDPAALRAAVHGAGTIYHLAALASVSRSIETPLVSHEACATGTVSLLDEARRHGVRRVVFAASSSAYGGASGGTLGQSEDQMPAAKSPYAAAKLAGEFYMQAFASAFGIESVRLRFFNIFGPRQRSDSPYSGVIARFVAAMTRGERPAIQGDGLQSRDFTYVANAVRALLLAGEVPEISGRVFNVGTGQSVSVRQLVDELNAILDTAIEPEYVPGRAGDVRFSQADLRNARLHLHYEPIVSFEDGLRATVKWFIETLGGLRKVQRVA